MRSLSMAGISTALSLFMGLLPVMAVAGVSPPPLETEAVCAGSTPGQAAGLVVESYDPATGTMALAYQPACSADDHHLEYGPLGAVATLGYSGQACGLGVTGGVSSFQPGPGSYFFLMVASDGSGQEGSYGTMQSAGVVTQRPSNTTQVSCAFVQNLAAACDAPPPAITLGMTAYRPQTEAYGAPLQRTVVPAAEMLSPGVGVRVNGDDDDSNSVPDRDHGTVAGENDLIEMILAADPPCANGVDYVLSRTDPSLQVWADAGKQTPVLVGSDMAVLTFAGGTMTVWVESVSAGSGDLELSARGSGGGLLAADLAHFYSFTSIVVALGGEGQVPADPLLEPGNHGTFKIALQLYNLGYDVHMYDEDVVAPDGAGEAYDEVVQAIREREVTSVTLFGYSHGGGSTNDLADRLDSNRGAIGAFEIIYTASMDSIGNSSDFDISKVTVLPPSTLYHANYYENPGCAFLCGELIAGADINLNVTLTPWGAGLTHFTVDDAPEVTDAIRDQILSMVPR
jgi:hypothetical protein